MLYVHTYQVRYLCKICFNCRILDFPPHIEEGDIIALKCRTEDGTFLYLGYVRSIKQPGPSKGRGTIDFIYEPTFDSFKVDNVCFSIKNLELDSSIRPPVDVLQNAPNHNIIWGDKFPIPLSKS